MALGFPSQDGKARGLSPPVKCSAPGAATLGSRKRLVGLMQCAGLRAVGIGNGFEWWGCICGQQIQVTLYFIRNPPFSSDT